MSSTIALVIASATVPASVPDLNPTNIALGIGLVSLGVLARFIKKQKR